MINDRLAWVATVLAYLTCPGLYWGARTRFAYRRDECGYLLRDRAPSTSTIHRFTFRLPRGPEHEQAAERSPISAKYGAVTSGQSPCLTGAGHRSLCDFLTPLLTLARIVSLTIRRILALTQLSGPLELSIATLASKRGALGHDGAFLVWTDEEQAEWHRPRLLASEAANIRRRRQEQEALWRTVR